jgi:DNA-binding transcriptional ArsR family regulator
MLDFLKDRPNTTGAVAATFAELDRTTVMLHLRVLEEADLIIVRRQGRERWNHLNAMPIKQIYDRWIGDYARHAVDMLAELKSGLET